MKILVLLSGGLDSTVALAKAVDECGINNVIALSIYYGQKHNKELDCAKNIAKYYNVEHILMDLEPIFNYSDCSLLSKNKDIKIPTGMYSSQLKENNGDLISTYVPFRNGLFLSVAASIALSKGVDLIYYAAHRDDAANNAYPDCSNEFNNSINDAIYIGSGNKIKVVGPFINMNKSDIVRIGINLNVPFNLTWSCYLGGIKHCGKCATCLDRKKAFLINGIKDMVEYEE